MAVLAYFVYVRDWIFNFGQMNRKRFVFASFCLVLLMCLAGCKRSLGDFTFTYSMESVGNYKLLVSFNADERFRIEEYNYLMDNLAHRRAPRIIEGDIDVKEFGELTELLRACDFFEMKDAYGFDEPASNDLDDVVYQVSFASDGEQKLISIRDNKNSRYPRALVKLIGFINSFINHHKNDNQPQ